jgi:hypothetical protein
MIPVTIAYITSRKDPKVSWFVDSLARSVPVEERHMIDLLFIDRHLWAITPEAGARYFPRGGLISLVDQTWQSEARQRMYADAVKGRFNYRAIPVAPCCHQGPFRLTTRDLFCAGVARNSAAIMAQHDYLLCVDDLSVLLPSWWPNAKYAAENNLCCAGVYRKQKQLVVEDGEIKSFEDFPSGRDTRWDHTSDSGIIPWRGNDVYGCSFGVPIAMMVAINGVDELCNGGGQDDYEMAIRMERAGAKWWINRNLQTWESEEGHHTEPSLPRERKIVTPECLPPGYDEYHYVNEAERFYSDHVFLNRLRNETNRFTTIAQWTNIRQARAEFKASQRILIPELPTHDWRDNQPLSEM